MEQINIQTNNNRSLVIGVGSGACKALNHIYLSNTVNEIDFLAIDTDEQELNSLNIPIDRQLLIG